MPYARVPGTFPAAITSFSDGTHSSSVAFSLTDTDHDVDVSAAVMPKVISTPVLDAVHEIVSWNETEWGHAAGVVVQVEFARGIGRNVMAPHTATSLRIPNLPPPWDYFNVQATDTAANMRVYLMTDSDGYRGVRNWISRSGGYFSLHQPGGFFGNWFYN
jgi:hypothetical protein